jgi:hypothetical protein
MYRLAKAILDSWKIQGFDTSQADVCLPYRGGDSNSFGCMDDSQRNRVRAVEMDEMRCINT